MFIQFSQNSFNFMILIERIRSHFATINNVQMDCRGHRVRFQEVVSNKVMQGKAGLGYNRIFHVLLHAIKFSSTSYTEKQTF